MWMGGLGSVGALSLQAGRSGERCFGTNRKYEDLVDLSFRNSALLPTYVWGCWHHRIFVGYSLHSSRRLGGRACSDEARP